MPSMSGGLQPHYLSYAWVALFDVIPAPVVAGGNSGRNPASHFSLLDPCVRRDDSKDENQHQHKREPRAHGKKNVVLVRSLRQK
jgi:hypothetical protein